MLTEIGFCDKGFYRRGMIFYLRCTHPSKQTEGVEGDVNIRIKDLVTNRGIYHKLFVYDIFVNNLFPPSERIKEIPRRSYKERSP